MHKKCERFVIGTQRGGTTALRHYLAAHKSMVVSTGKEVHFFDRSPRDIPTRFLRRAALRTCFPLRSPGKLVDVTPAYMYWPGALESLADTVRNPRCVACLRSPVARAVSQWRLEYSRGRETLPFSEAIRRPVDEQHFRNHSYIQRGCYDTQVTRAWDIIGEERVVLIRSDELRDDPDRTLAPVWRLFEVPADPMEKSVVHASPISFQPDPADIEFLLATFAPSIVRLQDLTGWDLGSWLDPTTAANL